MRPRRPIRIAVFNHKGGIGKTTLALNISAALGRLKKRVLMVDSDPQCNLTAYLFGEDVIDQLLAESDSESGRTIWSALRGVTEGNSHIRKIRPYETSLSNVSLVPGDVKLSNYEAALGNLWLEAAARHERGLLGTVALSELITKCCERASYDFVVYDTGPNIGSLNRVILLDCDYFIVPASYDLFSVRALNTLGRTLKGWIRDWKLIASIAPDDVPLLPGRPEFLGYIPIEFRGLNHGSKVRSHFESQLQTRIHTDIMKVLPTKKGGVARSASSKKLGTVHDYRELITLSQQQGRPVFSVDLTGVAESKSLSEQRAAAEEEFISIARGVIRKTRNT